MKSYGVRFAVGAVAVLLGVYAVARAQKDRQDHSESWSAQAKVEDPPAEPIEGLPPGSQEPWISEPDSAVAVGRQGSEIQTAAVESIADQADPNIQLVQHTEPMTDASTPAAIESSSETEAEPAFASAAMQMFRPDDQGEVAAMEVAPDPEPQAETSTDWTMPPANESEVVAEGNEAASGPAFGGATLSLPTMTAEAPSEPAVSTPAIPAFTDSPDPSRDVVTAESSATPGNALRDGSGPANLLRGDAVEPTQVNSTYADGGLSSDPQSLSGMAPTNANDPAMNAPPNFGGQPSPGAPQAPAQAAAAPAQTGSGGGAYADSGPYPQNGFADAPALRGAPDQTQPNPSPVNSYNDAPQRRVATLGGDATLRGQFAADPNPTNNSTNGGMSGGNAAMIPQAMSPPAGALPIEAAATIDAPGERRLEGVQTPTVIIQKRAPAEVKVGKPATFAIQVQNIGSVEALDVQVHDRIPAGMRLIDASPAPVQQGNLLMWQLGALAAGDERTLTLQLVPETEGELGSVARVSFEAAASVRTISTRPELKVTQRTVETVLIGQQLEIELEVSNPGTGDATGVVLQEDVPEGLQHPKGKQLDNALGTLAPGEIRKQILRLRAVKPGVVQNTIRLTGDDGLEAEHTVAVQVVAPNLQVELAGPKRRFLERPATFQLNVANDGTADATNVEIAVQLDRGFTFVSTDFEGQYDPSRHTVYWSLASLPAGERGTVPLTLLPVQEGEQAIAIDIRADLGAAVRSEQKMTVESFAELAFEIDNGGGPIEIGAETIYEIRLANSGSKPDSNVQVQLQLPQGLELVSTDAEAGSDGRGTVAFQPLPKLEPGAEQSFRVRLKGVAPGTHVVKATIVSDQSAVPVTKEESTMVYTDR